MGIDAIVKHLWRRDGQLRWWRSDTYRNVFWYYAEDRKYLIWVMGRDGLRIMIVEAFSPSAAIRKALTPEEQIELAYEKEANGGCEAADAMEREKKKYEYALKWKDGYISSPSDDMSRQTEFKRIHSHVLLTLIRREVGEWEEVK